MTTALPRRFTRGKMLGYYSCKHFFYNFVRPQVTSTGKPEEERYWPAGGNKLVPTVTPAAMHFIAEHSRVLDFVAFFSTESVNNIRTSLNRAVEGTVTSQGSVPSSAMLKARAQLDQYLLHESLAYELVLTRTVDNFLCFVAELLALIYGSKPDMLRSSEQERLDFVLQYPTMDQLRAAIAEKRVERLSYLGLRDLANYIESHMGFALFTSPEHLSKAALIVEYRNLCVHNRGIVSA